MTSDPKTREPQFPPNSSPRVWFITSAASPLATALIRHLLTHGDYVAAGTIRRDFESENERNEELLQLSAEHSDVETNRNHKGKLKIIDVDCRNLAQCQAAIATVVQTWEKIDVLFCCSSEALVGAVEELSASTALELLVCDQFETNYFGMVNIIKTILPSMRGKKNGHIIILTGITGHIGTPGFAMYCAAQWALEGFCDSLAYEIAPFNIKLTIVQPNLEVNVLTNKVIFAPAMPEYTPESNPAPHIREILVNTINRSQESMATTTDGRIWPSLSRSPNAITSLYPILPSSTKNALVSETIFALAAIGGHDNPPARHIVGFDGVASVKEKLKTVSEELEDFIEVSTAADIHVEQERDHDVDGKSEDED